MAAGNPARQSQLPIGAPAAFTSPSRPWPHLPFAADAPLPLEVFLTLLQLRELGRGGGLPSAAPPRAEACATASSASREGDEGGGGAAGGSGRVRVLTAVAGAARLPTLGGQRPVGQGRVAGTTWASWHFGCMKHQNILP